jgi:hypothetical protein
MRQPPQAGEPQRPKGTPQALLRRRDRRKPLTITVTYRGGPECWWELRARGAIVRRPGHVALEDVLSQFDGALER